MLWLYIIAIVIGYLIGSISPAYILGKLMRGIDIRNYGSKNAGAMNAFRVLGPFPGIVTLTFDLIKGILAFYIAHLLLVGTKLSQAYLSGMPFVVMCLAGFAAIAGHNWPFYMQFRGGKGAATAGGIIILLIILLFQPYFWTATSLFEVPGAIPLIIVAAFGIATLLITGSANLAAFISYPPFILLLLILRPGTLATTISLFLIYSFAVSIINIKTKAGGLKGDILLAKKRKKELKLWRKALRFASLAFPIAYFWLDKTLVLAAIGAVLLVFLVLDISKKRILKLYKKSEPKISGFSWYLLGTLIATAFFPKQISILAMMFGAVGDNAAVLVGIPFGRTKLVGQKTLQGTVACLAFSFLAGLIAMPFLNVSLLLILFGAIAATIAELLSGWYDNLTMAPFAAAIMSILVRFF